MASTQAMRPKVKKLGPMCVQTRNAAGELEIAPMPAFTIGGPVRTPPPRLAAPVDVPADVPRPVVAVPAAVPTAEAQPAVEVQPASASQLPVEAASPEDARQESGPDVAPATVPAASVGTERAGPQNEPPAAGSSQATAVHDPAVQSRVSQAAEAARPAAAAMPPAPSEGLLEACAQLQAGEPQSAQQNCTVSQPSQPADASTTAAGHLHGAHVPEATTDQASVRCGSSQAAPASVSTSAGGPAAGSPANHHAQAEPAVPGREPSASAMGCASPDNALSSRAHGGKQPFEPGTANGVAGHAERAGVGETAAVAAQRAAFEAALGMALEPDLDAFVATQLSAAASRVGMAQQPAAAPVSQLLEVQQSTPQTALTAPLAPVCDPVAMFLNDGPDR